MKLNDLLQTHQIDPREVLVFRHRPHEPELRKVLPWFAAEKPAVFNAYQQTQGPRLEGVMKAMVGSGFVASFIGHGPGKALFEGLYSIKSAAPLTYREFWKVPAYIEMKTFGMKGWSPDDERHSQLWFDLKRNNFCESWRGKLIVNWPPPERSWWRRAHRNEIAVAAILEESAFAREMPQWNDIDITWAELGVLPNSWRSALQQWRGVYYIFDTADTKGYVGSAYGAANLLGRWRDYATRGHGGNSLLRKRDPKNFRFSILQLVAPDMGAGDIVDLEGSWKRRLHTRQPYGLNDN